MKIISKITLSIFILLTNKIYTDDLFEQQVENKVAVIFGVTGQDGCYLTKFLLEKNYKVIGITRKTSSSNTQKLYKMIQPISHLAKNLTLLNGDITDHYFVSEILKKYLPDEVYNLAAQSSVKNSFDEPLYTLTVNAIGTLNILVSIHSIYNKKKTRFYQASTCEIFGKAKKIPQDENTPFYPRSPYGVAKACAFWETVNYREAYNIYACNGILFNHESPLRGENFVTRSITKGVTKVTNGLQKCLCLGNLNAKRDWGFAGDYVEAMWLMLQQETAEDFVIATGDTHSVKEFVEEAFKLKGIIIEWQGDGINEVGIDKYTRKKLVSVDPQYFRPTEVDYLKGDPSKAKNKLGWTPKISFNELVKLMLENETND